MAIEIVDFPIKNKVIFHSYVSHNQIVVDLLEPPPCRGFPSANWMDFFMRPEVERCFTGKLAQGMRVE